LAHGGTEYMKLRENGVGCTWQAGRGRYMIAEGSWSQLGRMRTKYGEKHHPKGRVMKTILGF